MFFSHSHHAHQRAQHHHLGIALDAATHAACMGSVTAAAGGGAGATPRHACGFVSSLLLSTLSMRLPADLVMQAHCQAQPALGAVASRCSQACFTHGSCNEELARWVVSMQLFCHAHRLPCKNHCIGNSHGTGRCPATSGLALSHWLCRCDCLKGYQGLECSTPMSSDDMLNASRIFNYVRVGVAGAPTTPVAAQSPYRPGELAACMGSGQKASPLPVEA